MSKMSLNGANLWIVSISLVKAGKGHSRPQVFMRINSLRPSDASIWVSKLATTGSDNGLLPGRHQASIWTNVGILLIGPPRTNVGEILTEIYILSLKKCIWKSRQEIGVILYRPLCVNLETQSLIWNVIWSVTRSHEQPWDEQNDI